jgi:hypothetical protein
MAYYYVQPHTAFLYVLYVHCLIMDIFGTFALGYCNKRNLGVSKIIVGTVLPVRRSVRWARGRSFRRSVDDEAHLKHCMSEVAAKLLYTQCQHFLLDH